jgi:hypothetical protein
MEPPTSRRATGCGRRTAHRGGRRASLLGWTADRGDGCAGMGGSRRCPAGRHRSARVRNVAGRGAGPPRMATPDRTAPARVRQAEPAGARLRDSEHRRHPRHRGLRTRAEKARCDLAEIETLPVTEAAHLVRDRAAPAEAEREATERSQAARDARTARLGQFRPSSDHGRTQPNRDGFGI